MGTYGEMWGVLKTRPASDIAPIGVAPDELSSIGKRLGVLGTHPASFDVKLVNILSACLSCLSSAALRATSRSISAMRRASFWRST